MFVGHLAVALGAKTAEPRAPLSAYVAAAFGLDLLWPVFLLAGIETVRVHPGVMPGWDNTPRRGESAYVFHGANPLSFRRWTARAAAAAVGAGEPSLVFVNAWNEWAEGAHLEPEARFGRAYLEAVRDAVGVDKRAARSAARPTSSRHTPTLRCSNSPRP